MAQFGENNFGFFGGLVGGNAISGTPCGSFYDTTIQSATLINTAYAMLLNSTDSTATNLCSVASGSRITVPQNGVYNIQFSAQLQRLVGGTVETVDIWLRKNDNNASGNVPFSNGHVSVQANATFLLPAWNYYIYLQANDFVELMWATTSTDIKLNYDTSTALHPATPSVIATINRIS